MSDNDRLDPEWTPKKKDVATHCYYGHLVLPGHKGCRVAGCKDAEPDLGYESVLTEKQEDHGN